MVNSILSQQCKETPESVQRSITRIIFADLSYDDRRCILVIPVLNDFIFSSCQTHFDKIVTDHTHPLFSRIIMNNYKTSTRAATTFRPEKARTQNRAKIFFSSFI